MGYPTRTSAQYDRTTFLGYLPTILLPSFPHINKIVSIQDPVNDVPPPAEGLRLSKALPDASPQTILFLSWGDAKSRYIEKYTSLYSELYPEARIILVETGMADFFWRPESTQRKVVDPVVKMLGKVTDNTLLVHVMSNAGSTRWAGINKAYFQSTGRTLSSASTILDSAPGRAHFQQTWASLTQSLPRAFLPRMILGFVFGTVLCIMHLGKLVLPGPDIYDYVRAQMNDTTAAVDGTRRCYIYSEKDEIIAWEDVEEHAKDAQQKGWSVEQVKFQGSTHVGHMKQDPEMYRQAIVRTWAGSSKL
ncbi:uncharacterized protein N7483_012440 [Penicillium malachiteum]|uniref:uncharacterized protein n=1 Tax=Penicillium malachiteum TaxID=1324776 RepID=UPI0025468167|nr:uncharacterized protein N7483_012440 [Penicillium malachiteum]KAJ5715259.1 hypothetical protein N7483_012440 [Penicillium malachiteum]